MRNFTTFLSLAAALTLSAAGTRTLAPNPFNGPLANPMPQVANPTAKADFKVLSAQQGAQRMEKTPEARAIQMQLNSFKAKAATNDGRFKAPNRAAGENTEVLLEENFDKMASGSDEEIDTSIDLSGYVTDFENGYCDPYACDIDPMYTQTPGWTGECVYQAGGAAALYYPGIGGILNTPNNLVFNGVIRVSFRVKAIGDYSCLLFVVPCKGSFENISMASDAVWFKTFKPADGWQDVVLEYDVPYAGEDGFLQFNGMNYDDGVIIDDLKVERVLDKVMAPRSINTTCYNDEGFTLYWTGDPKSDAYIVNLWEKSTDSSESNTVNLDFNNMTYDADGIVSDFGAPEDWTFDFATIGSQVGVNPNDGTEAIRVINDEDRYWNEYWMPSITTPTGSTVNEFKAEIVVTKENTVVNDNWGYAMEPEWALYGIDASGDISYLALGLIDNVEGTTINIDLSAVEDYWYGDVSDYTGQYYGLILYVVPDGDGEVIIDNVSFTSAGSLVETQIASDLKTVDEQVVFTGLDMSGHHYYTVQAVYGDYVTPEMEREEAFGIPAPVALPATNIDERGEFTANWEPVPGASAYYIHTKLRYTAPEDVKDYAVINDSFDKTPFSGSYTMENPYCYDYYTVKSLDDFTIVPGWTAYGAVIADGMIGCAADTDEIRYICTPEINLTNGDGEATVYVKAYGTYGDCLATMYQDGTVYYDYFDANGEVEATHTFSNLDYGCFYFYSGRTGDRIFLDDVRISQDLYAGETVEVNAGIWYIGDGTASSLDFAGLDIVPGMKYYYSVYSYAYNDRLYRDYLSESSNDIEVDFNTDALNSIEAQTLSVTVDGNTIRVSEAANIYDLQGRQIAAGATSATVANGIYVVKTSTKACKVIVK